MKKIYFLVVGLLLILNTQLNAQCTGGRYHSLVFPGSPTVTSDVVYGNNLDQNGATFSLKLDVYRPACDTATHRPLIVFAHGGSFVSGDKADPGYAATAIALAQLGYVVASINYRLGFPTSGLPAQYGFNSAIMRGLHDGRAAVRFMRNNALNGGNTYGIDPNKIFFGGVSAGGIIALHLAYQNTSGEMNMNCGGQPGTEQSSIEGTSNGTGSPINSISSAVTGIISISGGIRDLNWITNNDIPCCLAHGTADGTVPYGNGTFGGFFPVSGSSTIAQKCASTGTTYCFLPMIGQDHTPANQAYVDTIATLMRNFLEHFTCNTTLNCAYNGSPAVLVPAISITMSSGTNPACSSAPVTFTATTTNPGPNYSIQWKKNGTNVGTGAATYTLSAPANNDVITCVLTTCSSLTTITSNAVTIQITGSVQPSVVIALTSGTFPVCAGQSLTFTATPTGGGTTPTYQWKKNGGNVGTGATYTLSSPAANDVITCVMTSNSPCASPTSATSNSLTVTLSAGVQPTVTIGISTGTNPTCSGQSITFTATPTNGGSSPGYQWKKNGSNVGTGPTYTLSSPTSGDAITCVMTSNLACANPTMDTSNAISVIISSTVAPAVAITVSSGNNPTCTGVGLTFTATPTNGGSSPTYQWKKNGSNVGTGATYTLSAPVNNDKISCVMTSNSPCANPTTATSATDTVKVSSTVAPTISIVLTTGTNPSCAGSSLTFTGTGTNGGTAPVYQWKKNGTNAGTGSTFTTASLVNGDSISCVLTSNSSCASPTTASSNGIKMIINAPPTISKTGNLLTSSAASGNQWYLNGQMINGAAGHTYTATANGSYTVKVGPCTSQAVQVVVTDIADITDNEHFLSVYPNPNNGEFNLSFTVTEKATYKLEVKNELGQLVYQETLNDFSGSYNGQIDVSKSGKGIYFLSVGDGQHAAVRRVVVY